MNAPAKRDLLWASRLLASHEEVLPYFEEAARLALDPLWLANDPEQREDLMRSREHDELLTTVLRTGGLFVFTKDDIPTGGMMPAEVLPPLPFPRMWIEVSGIAQDECAFIDLDGRRAFWLGFAILEEEVGARWNVLMPMFDEEGLNEILDARPDWFTTFAHLPIATRQYHLIIHPAEGRVSPAIARADLSAFNERLAAVSESDRRLAEQAIYGTLLLPELLVQLIHTLGVRYVPAQVHRATRKEFQRKYGFSHPQLYFVQLRSSDEPQAGHGDKVFRHRWIVRGHYRRSDAGSHLVSSKGLCTWVRPYIKGPAGAPWKGRPIYTTVVEEAA